MAEFRMPWLGADMEDGTLLQWLVKPGQLVQRGDIVASVETDKAAVEIEIFESWVIEQLLIQEGEKVPVGIVLATLLPAGVVVPSPVHAAPPVEPPAFSPPQPLPTPPVHAPVRATPVARKLAAERHLALDRLKGRRPRRTDHAARCRDGRGDGNRPRIAAGPAAGARARHRPGGRCRYGDRTAP
jgi:pyruvate dehydrogenase E2 component (dihydrolipoamide acetyltransferase)